MDITESCLHMFKSSVDKGRRVIFLSEYRRLISYMYAYDNGIKNKNVGFAKTECRGENVKLWINLKGAYTQVEDYRVHFFVRKNDAIVGIYVGDIAINSGMGQFFAAKPLSDIEEPFSDICGLYIDGGSGERMFASQWDDLPFDVKKVISMDDYLAQSVVIEDKMSDAADVTEHTHTSSVFEEESKAHAAATAEAPVWERPIKMVYIADSNSESGDEKPESSGKETAKDNSVLHVSEDAPAAKPHSKMDMLFDGKEPVLAFSEDEIYDCVDIGLDELPKISAADSGLINNSFVNHGYFNFHHLLLGKKDGNILVVGVPGVYNRREKVTANMFGFEKFKFSMRSDVCMNHFGYWYKEYQYQ